MLWIALAVMWLLGVDRPAGGSCPLWLADAVLLLVVVLYGVAGWPPWLLSPPPAG